MTAIAILVQPPGITQHRPQMGEEEKEVSMCKVAIYGTGIRMKTKIRRAISILLPNFIKNYSYQYPNIPSKYLKLFSHIFNSICIFVKAAA